MFKRCASAHRGQHQRCGLVDEGVGVHVARVRKSDPAVVGIDVGQPLGAHAVAPRGQRVGGGDGGESREQLPHRAQVLLDAGAACATDGVFKQRIERDRRAQAMQLFVIAPAAACIANQLGRAAGILGPRNRQAGALHAVLRAQRLAAADQRGLHLAARDLLAKQVHQVLRHVAAVPAVEVARGTQAESSGHAQGRVARCADVAGEAVRRVGERAQHRHRVDRAESAPAAAPLSASAWRAAAATRSYGERPAATGVVRSVTSPQPTRIGVRGSGDSLIVGSPRSSSRRGWVPGRTSAASRGCPCAR